MGKYTRVNSLNQFEALSSEMVPKIVEHIEKGLSLAPMFKIFYLRNPGSLPLWKD